MELSPFQLIAGIASTAASGSGVSSLFHWLGNRGKNHSYTMGAVDHAVQTAMQSVTSQLDRTEIRLSKAEKHTQDCERELAECKAEIGRLMSGRIAAYGEKAPE